MKKAMKRWVLCVLLALGILCGAAGAEEAPDYEISNYAMYIDILADGSARIREEVIYSCPQAYEGYTFFVEGEQEPGQIEIWADGTLLEESACTLTPEENGWQISLSSPGDNDWRTFACAYTLADYACRYQDTAMIDGMLITQNHAALYQNATVIVTLPADDGEILVYPRDYSGEVRCQYGMVSFGPTDLAQNEGISAQLLFPQAWLSEATATDEAVREAIVAEKTRIQEEETRAGNAMKLGKRIAGAVYLVVFAVLLAWEIKKYGLTARKPGQSDWTLVDRYPAALSGFVVEETADSDVLAGTLATLVGRGALDLSEDAEGRLAITRRGKAALSASEKAALDYVLDGRESASLSGLKAPDYDRARRCEARLKAYGDALTQEAEKAGLKRRNESELIAISTASILCGLTLTIIMLMMGEMMILEGAAVSVGMFIMMKQYNRVRHLTDAGEALKMAALALTGMDEAAQRALSQRLDQAAALGALGELNDPKAGLLNKLASALREAHVHNAGMRKKAKS